MNPDVKTQNKWSQPINYQTIKKEEWSENTVPWGKPLPLPAKCVRFVFKTNTKPCENMEECKMCLRSVEEDHRKTYRLYEINYNYMIGGDGNVYEGRGFRRKISRMPSHESSKVLEYLTIGYIGDYEVIPKYMVDIAYAFMRDMSNQGLLAANVVGNNRALKLSQAL